MTTARHVIFGTARSVWPPSTRCGAATRPTGWSTAAATPGCPDDVEIPGPACTTTAAAHRSVTAQIPALQAGGLAAAEATGARLVFLKNDYLYGHPAGHRSPRIAHTRPPHEGTTPRPDGA